MLRELLRPASYLGIQHPSLALAAVNWYLPIGCAALLVGSAALLQFSVDVFSANGVLSRILGFVQSLPGFYLAALAAVATFNKPGMDRPMPGVSPTSTVLYNGAYVKVKLTRRRFLSLMFAFLTAESFFLTLCAIGAITFAEPLKAAIPSVAHVWLKVGFSFCFLLAAFQMLCITLWSLYYLGERIHTSDRLEPIQNAEREAGVNQSEGPPES